MKRAILMDKKDHYGGNRQTFESALVISDLHCIHILSFARHANKKAKHFPARWKGNQFRRFLPTSWSQFRARHHGIQTVDIRLSHACNMSITGEQKSRNMAPTEFDYQTTNYVLKSFVSLISKRGFHPWCFSVCCHSGSLRTEVVWVNHAWLDPN